MLMEGLIDQSTADAAADLYTGCKGESLFKLNMAVYIHEGERESEGPRFKNAYLDLSILPPRHCMYIDCSLPWSE